MIASVSIIIPTYNGEEFIKETIDSCLKQTYSNIAITVIDDGSTDGTRELLAVYKNTLTVILNEENLGIVKNNNKAVDTISSDYLLLLGHDDLLAEDHVEKMIKEFDDDVVAVHCNSILINAHNETIGLLKDDYIQKLKTQNCLYELSIDNFIGSCGMLHKTSVFKELNGWDERFLHYGEWLYYVRAIRYGKIKYTTQTQAYYRRHETNITNSFRDKKVKRTLYSYIDECRNLAHRTHKNSIKEFLFFYYRSCKLILIRELPVSIKKMIRHLK